MTPRQISNATQDIQIKLMRHYGPPKDSTIGNPNHYMSFDPGEGTGWATFGENGYLTGFGNVYADVNGVSNLFRDKFWKGEEPKPKVVIYEKWKLLKPKEFYGSTLLSCQVVGVIRAFAHLALAELYSHETNIKSTAEKWSGLVPVGTHSTQHWVDAVNHGWYHLQRNKKITPRLMWDEPGGM